MFFWYSNGDWSMDIHQQFSISGMVFFLAGAVVVWKTRVQPMVALITAESEFLSASNSGCLGLFIRVILYEPQQSQTAATNIYEDNDACIILANSSAATTKMWHIAMRDFA
jgi:hypothetical protein